VRILTITPTTGGAVLRAYVVHPTSLKLNTAGSAVLRRRRKAFEIVRKFSEGIEPRAFQLLTAPLVTPTSSAVAVVPPNAATILSTERSMFDTSLRSVNMSSVDAGAIDYHPQFGSNGGMDSKEQIGERLAFLLKAKGRSAADICRLIDIDVARWSLYKNGQRLLDLEVAARLCDYLGVTLDFLYRGNPQNIDDKLLIAMREIQQAEERGIGVDQTSPMRLRRKARMVAIHRPGIANQ